MKSIYILILGVTFMFSCDKRIDVLTEGNLAPTTVLQITNTYAYITANVSGTVVSDSCKTNNFYRFNIQITDESDISNLKFSGDGSLFMDGIPFVEGDYVNTTRYFEWLETSPGQKIFNLEIIDKQGKSVVYTFNLNVFVNVPPTISWVLEDVGNLDPYEKRIVVSGQDGDFYFGGNIAYYRFMIDGDTTDFPSNTMYYIFPSPGLYNIGVLAVDNDGGISNEITINNYQIN